MRQHIKTLFIVVVSVLGTLVYVDATTKKNNSPWSNGFGCSTEDITDMYADYIDEWKMLISKSFDGAEMQVFGDKPAPDIIGPDPDPKKCICGGSGWIQQGDGHKTKCPYHGEGMGGVLKDHGLKIQKYK
jgi:hypothetical protein